MNRAVVILDDDRVTAKVAEKAVASLGHEVHSFLVPDEALEHMRAHKTDIIVLDLEMPDMNGIEVLEWVKDFNPFVRIVTMTGCAPVNKLLDCWRLGADCCVLKGPGFVDRLKSAVVHSESSTTQWEESINTVRKGSRGGAD